MDQDTYGKPTPTQLSIVRKYVKDELVHDLGAGNLELSKQLLKLGAKKVIAIDPKVPIRSPKRGIQTVQKYFHEVPDTCPQVAFLSWPTNAHIPALYVILKKADVIIYLGTNTNGSSCGHPDLFSILVQRELLAYEPHPENTLIIVGKTPSRRPPRGEEIAGLSMYMGDYNSYEEAENICLTSSPSLKGIQ